MNLLETYKRRLKVSESVYAREHENSPLSEAKKQTIARVLANTSAYLNEAYSNSTGTQRSDMGTFKKFALDLTTVALPNLIAHDLVIVKPMTSMTGYIQYLSFVAGSNKGGVTQGTVFNDPFKLGAMTEDRVNYTSSAVTETVSEKDAENFTLAWSPVTKGAFKVGAKAFDVKVITSRQSVPLYGTVDAAGKVTIDSEASGGLGNLVAGDRVAYLYDNVTIPQDDLPIYNAKMTGISLEAHARRIAIYYSQMAAFQAKQEMGMDLGQVLATQACAELNYEIDTEVVKLLVDHAKEEEGLTFNKRVPAGVSKAEHYEGFAEVIETASQVIYDRTQKFGANYMICASNIKPMLSLMRGWKAASTSKINGPYFAGTLNNIKVFISPAVKPGKFVLGFNGDDLVTSAAVYAPYMAVVPTALLQFADGGTTQGFSTLYDLKLLNEALLVSGKVEDKEQVIATKVAE